jgi:2-haloacid dehalogenase
MSEPGVRALLFDIFGTCVDWRSGITREVGLIARQKGIGVDGAVFTDAWRANYQPSMERVRSGQRPWTILDVLHRETLEALLPRFGLEALNEEERADLNRAWHRLDPWPDVVEGLTRLKQRYIISPLSNGNVGLLAKMAKRAGLPWDLILSAETSRAYKPLPASYLNAVEMLGLAPGEVMMVAAHNNDLAAARSHGLGTAFVARPTEHGPKQTTDLTATGPWDVVATDFRELAVKMGV